jgi:hypothetical protein
MSICGKNACKKCEYKDRCANSDERQQTNEEWFASLPTEEKAKVFANATYSTAEAPLNILVGGKEAEQKKWEMWLKQPRQKE